MVVALQFTINTESNIKRKENTDNFLLNYDNYITNLLFRLKHGLAIVKWIDKLCAGENQTRDSWNLV